MDSFIQIDISINDSQIDRLENRKMNRFMDRFMKMKHVLLGIKHLYFEVKIDGLPDKITE